MLVASTSEVGFDYSRRQLFANCRHRGLARPLVALASNCSRETRRPTWSTAAHRPPQIAQISQQYRGA